MRLIDADKYMNHLRAEINSEADIIAKYIKEDDPIGTVKDCGRIGRLQGLQWNRNMLELDCFTVEAIPKDNVYKAIQEIVKYNHEGFINISVERLGKILTDCGVSEYYNVCKENEDGKDN